MTTSARISWNLPPEDLLDADYIPSLWGVQKLALLVLVAIIVGPISLLGSQTLQYLIASMFQETRVCQDGLTDERLSTWSQECL